VREVKCLVSRDLHNFGREENFLNWDKECWYNKGGVSGQPFEQFEQGDV
jgi:hypothetical protein